MDHAALIRSLEEGEPCGLTMRCKDRVPSACLCAQAADALASLTKELEEARRGVARWKGIVRDARAKSGKWGEQARWELPDPDWRPRTEEELARLREEEKPQPAPDSSVLSRDAGGGE